MTGIFAPAQLVGYVALVLGVSAFLQRSDQRLRLLNAGQSVAYALHFLLLGNAAAVAGSAISSARSFLALRYRSRFLAALFVAVALGIGWQVVRTPIGWLPIVASCIATVAIFLSHGIALRLAVLVATLLWLANNIVSGSIGGTILETIVAVANISTIARLVAARRRE